MSQQALDRADGAIPDLESYIALRRDTSGCKPCWALIEYANNLDIPDEIMEHPIIRSLGEAANDLVTWSNVRFHLPSASCDLVVLTHFMVFRTSFHIMSSNPRAIRIT